MIKPELETELLAIIGDCYSLSVPSGDLEQMICCSWVRLSCASSATSDDVAVVARGTVAFDAHECERVSEVGASRTVPAPHARWAYRACGPLGRSQPGEP